jgi:hypothetical protein
MNVVNFDELYPGRFLKAGLLKGNVNYTIEDVYLDTLEGEKGDQKKGIVKFKETELELTLNKTNGVCLKAMFGKELKNWIGKRVTLCSEVVKFGKENVDAVRVYGSPDIAEDVNAIIQMPRKKPITRVLHRMKSDRERLIDAINNAENMERLEKLSRYCNDDETKALYEQREETLLGA